MARILLASLRNGGNTMPTGQKSHSTIDPTAVHDFARSLNRMVDPDALLATVGDRLRDLFGPDLILVLQVEPRNGDFTPAYSIGFDEEALNTFGLSSHGSLAEWFAANEECIGLSLDLGLPEHLDPSERELLRRLAVQICMPLVSMNRLIGMILLGSTNPGWRLKGEDLALLEMLSGQVALALENAALHSEQKERLHRLHLAQGLAMSGRLAAGIAHEIRNPLTAIRSTVQYIADELAEEDPKRVLAQGLLSEVDRIQQTTEGLLNLSRTRNSERREIDLLVTLDQALLLIEAQARQQGVEIEKEYEGERFIVLGDADQLRQVFLNLLLNALEAIPEVGKITVRVGPWQSRYSPRDRRVQIEIADTGIGIRNEDLGRILDPFFTTKGEGTGLGLAICQSILARHEGEIDVRSAVGQGTTFSVLLPGHD